MSEDGPGDLTNYVRTAHPIGIREVCRVVFLTVRDMSGIVQKNKEDSSYSTEWTYEDLDAKIREQTVIVDELSSLKANRVR
ncbi:hypothetical protein NDU88_003744 [Pleurodeles waltl]|uniref:Uncharacterized protein n=1 Tax=Pleurodeles waltl TaxID=8319 RepID=A0AAV7UDC5_PLEWA|nr:hypothetical protein NDU88_003744 [Pleurodeles waltl]